MEVEKILTVIANGEDSKHQFKANVMRPDSIAQEMIAFSNSKGGIILIGVTEDGEIAGLTSDDIKRLNQLVPNAATNNMQPSISPEIQNISFPEGKVMTVSVEEGLSKPYMDSNSHFFVKSGVDKRKVTAREALQRIVQSVALVHADSLPVHGSSITDIDREFFNAFFYKEFGEYIEDQELSFARLLENMNLARNDKLNTCATLLFTTRPQLQFPDFHVKAAAFPGNDIEDEYYLDSRDVEGKLSVIFQNVMGFIGANLRYVQNGQSVNSIGELEIPKIVFKELIVNALIHRDYFISAPVRVLIFADRVEIISPGYLPDNLTIENIKIGNSIIRNPTLASFASKMLPYRGIGGGIKRAIRAYPDIKFIDDQEGSTFKVIIQRNQGHNLVSG